MAFPPPPLANGNINACLGTSLIRSPLSQRILDKLNKKNRVKIGIKVPQVI
jgi:hypothetical protein